MEIMPRSESATSPSAIIDFLLGLSSIPKRAPLMKTEPGRD